MPRDLFGQMIRPFDGAGARSRLTVPLSLAAHALAVVAVVVAPLLASDALPVLRTSLSLEMVTPVVPPPPPLRRVAPPPDTPEAAATVPLHAPEGIAPEPTVEPVETGTADLGAITGEITSADALTPPPPPPVHAAQPSIVRPGGKIQPPTKVHDATPVYPAIAQAARVQGVVIIEATIGIDGEVVDARVLRSVPLLDEAALQAVRQWRYTPTRLNGQPVAVVMTVTVNFRLG